MKTMQFEGKTLQQYMAVVTRNGVRQSATEFSDWFENDAAAITGYKEIMIEQGYTVISVKIGSPTEVEIV